MRQMALQGRLLLADMVLQEGATKWVPASQVEGVFPPSETAPPLPPPMAKWVPASQVEGILPPPPMALPISALPSYHALAKPDTSLPGSTRSRAGGQVPMSSGVTSGRQGQFKVIGEKLKATWAMKAAIIGGALTVAVLLISLTIILLPGRSTRS